MGKVTLSMLLHNFPDIGKVYATVRARDAAESKIRFWTSIVTSPTFDPLREKYGDGFEDFIKSKVVPVNGDVGNEYLGLDEKDAKKVMRDTDIIINGAGNVTFNPPLESAPVSYTHLETGKVIKAFCHRVHREHRGES